MLNLARQSSKLHGHLVNSKLTASEFNSTDKTEILRLASLVETFAEPLAEAQLEPLLVYTPCNGKFFSWRSQHKLETLQAEWDLCHQKLSKLRHALVAETDAAKKFQLEQQIFDEKAKLAYLDNEMKKIESALQP
ncbi:hypothetical protein [uncultured Nostoc sp.]|uniref:hypothetical protein n=1 Tax=uncultured Nostoc sp. TaxID=340711 RepID=UPI0035CA70AF